MIHQALAYHVYPILPYLLGVAKSSISSSMLQMAADQTFPWS